MMTQTTLFTNEQCPPPPRPDRFSEDVLRAAAKALLVELKVTGDDAERVLMKAIRFESDGYRIARALDNEGWSVDAEMVETLDGALCHQTTAHDAIIAAWVNEWRIEPDADVGARVRFKQRGATLEGIVDRVETKRAQYVVRCHVLGHVRPGTPECDDAMKSGRAVTGTYVNYEDAEVICE